VGIARYTFTDITWIEENLVNTALGIAPVTQTPAK
jgi:hypothetical protein